MDDLELIKQKINVVDLLSEYLPLKKSGVNFKANCPFHQEKTASFMVSPERGIWHCFGCDKGGDIFKFIMEKEGLSFPEALEVLAQKAGVTLKRKERNQSKDEKERLYEANLKAQQFFHYMLLEHPLGKKAREYLKQRGLTEEIIKEFGIGYAPQSWEALTKFLKKRGFSEGEMIKAGLTVPSRKGCYDRFRGRVTFPLIDIRNRVMGFSGRVLDKSEPKYINTPQTPIFDKGRMLFGLNLSKSAIREAKSIILTEGEMDTIMSYQSGVKNVVASKGTALTENQIDLIKKYTDTIDLCFDMDLAGDSAARRGIEMADGAGLNIRVIRLPEGKDPGELCLKDPQSWKKAAAEAQPIYDYYLESISKRYNLKIASEKRAAFVEILPIWKKIHDPLVLDHYVQKLAALFQIKDELIYKQLEKLNHSSSSWKTQVTPKVSSSAGRDDKVKLVDRRKLLEEYLISLLLHIPASFTYIPNFPETLFTQEDLKQIYVLLVLFLDSISFKGRSFKIAEFASSLSPELLERVDTLYLMQLDEKLTEGSKWQKEIDGVVTELKKMLIKSSLEKLSLEIKNAQEFDRMESLEILNKKFRDLSIKLKNL